MRRRWKCGRWEGATDGGQHANSQLSLAEASQAGMSAFPQVGAASTLGKAASQRPSTREGGRDQGPCGLALGLGPDWDWDLKSGTGQLPRSKAHSSPLLLLYVHTVCPGLTVRLGLLSSVRLARWGGAGQLQLSDQTTVCRYQLTFCLFTTTYPV